MVTAGWPEAKKYKNTKKNNRKKNRNKNQSKNSVDLLFTIQFSLVHI